MILEEIKNSIDWQKLAPILEERTSWPKRESSKIYTNPLQNLPEIENLSFDLSRDSIRIGQREDISAECLSQLQTKLKELKNWRKGPFCFFGEQIDAEWQSHLKWRRLKLKRDDIEGKTILDVGCNNGYFLFKLAHYNPTWAMGIDPVLQCWSQFHFMNHFLKLKTIEFHLLGVDEIEHFNRCFDIIFSMGILYHHRNPLQQLLHMREALNPGGVLYLETIGIPGENEFALFPKERYANMKNVYFLPTINCLLNMLDRCKFVDVKIVSREWDKELEQRSTIWAPGPSYKDFLDPKDAKLTREGYPAPERFIIKAKKKEVC